jgi:hypothetical protein
MERAHVVCSTRKERCSLRAAHAERWVDSRRERPLLRNMSFTHEWPLLADQRLCQFDSRELSLHSAEADDR